MNPTGHHVNINVNGDACAYAHPDGKDAVSIKVRTGDRVKWKCDHGNFSVLFKQHSPFSEVALHGRKGDETVEAIVKSDGGTFHYAVTVSADHGLIVDDPEVIVNNGD